MLKKHVDVLDLSTRPSPLPLPHSLSLSLSRSISHSGVTQNEAAVAVGLRHAHSCYCPDSRAADRSRLEYRVPGYECQKAPAKDTHVSVPTLGKREGETRALF